MEFLVLGSSVAAWACAGQYGPLGAFVAIRRGPAPITLDVVHVGEGSTEWASLSSSKIVAVRRRLWLTLTRSRLIFHRLRLAPDGPTLNESGFFEKKHRQTCYLKPAKVSRGVGLTK